MSNQDAAIDFADTILQHFPPYRWEDHQEKAWAERLVRELAGFSSDVVRRAASEIVRTRKKPQTPLVSECIDACVSSKRWVEANRNHGKLPIEQADMAAGNLDWTSDRLKLASELMNTTMGEQAAKDGWVGALWSFSRKNARLPQYGKEVDGCKRTAKEFDDAYAKVVCDQSAMGRMLEKLGAEMLRRRHATERRVLGGRK